MQPARTSLKTHNSLWILNLYSVILDFDRREMPLTFFKNASNTSYLQANAYRKIDTKFTRVYDDYFKFSVSGF